MKEHVEQIIHLYENPNGMKAPILLDLLLLKIYPYLIPFSIRSFLFK